MRVYEFNFHLLCYVVTPFLSSFFLPVPSMSAPYRRVLSGTFFVFDGQIFQIHGAAIGARSPWRQRLAAYGAITRCFITEF